MAKVTWPILFLAVRSAILATAWLLVLICGYLVSVGSGGQANRYLVKNEDIQVVWLQGFYRPNSVVLALCGLALLTSLNKASQTDAVCSPVRPVSAAAAEQSAARHLSDSESPRCRRTCWRRYWDTGWTDPAGDKTTAPGTLTFTSTHD